MAASGIRVVDSNLWLALCFGGHLHHELALAWFDSLGNGEAGFCRITHELEDCWRKLTRSSEPNHRLWTDAYLAAFAIAARIKLSTIDQKFSNFLEVEV